MQSETERFGAQQPKAEQPKVEQPKTEQPKGEQFKTGNPNGQNNAQQSTSQNVNYNSYYGYQSANVPPPPISPKPVQKQESMAEKLKEDFVSAIGGFVSTITGRSRKTNENVKTVKQKKLSGFNKKNKK